MKRILFIAISVPALVLSFSRLRNKDPTAAPSVPIVFYQGDGFGQYSNCVGNHGGCEVTVPTAGLAPPPANAVKGRLYLLETDALLLEFEKQNFRPEDYQEQFKGGRFYQPSPIVIDPRLLKSLGMKDSIRFLQDGFHPIEFDQEKVRIFL